MHIIRRHVQTVVSTIFSFNVLRQLSLIFSHVLFMVGLLNGYPTFITSILMIGLNTAVIGDVAGHLGCFIYLKDSVNAIAFVALGTSVPGNRKQQNKQINK